VSKDKIYDRMLCIELQTFDGDQLDQEYYKLAVYLTQTVLPTVFKRAQTSIKMPMVLNYRANVITWTLILHWFMFMFEPQHCQVSLFELLKTRNSVWGMFTLPCGTIHNDRTDIT
jgi:hypothetical protein